MTDREFVAERPSFLDLLDRVLDGIADLCRVLTGVALVVLTVIFGWLVFGRYVLNATPAWVEQVSLLLVMTIAFLGAAVGGCMTTRIWPSWPSAISCRAGRGPFWLR
ncbi:TRAP transporter small permease [Jhaorihella thermophila]